MLINPDSLIRLYIYLGYDKRRKVTKALEDCINIDTIEYILYLKAGDVIHRRIELVRLVLSHKALSVIYYEEGRIAFANIRVEGVPTHIN